jgi:hypothetical protein
MCATVLVLNLIINDIIQTTNYMVVWRWAKKLYTDKFKVMIRKLILIIVILCVWLMKPSLSEETFLSTEYRRLRNYKEVK